MRITQIQFAPWDKIYYFNPGGLDLKVGDKVIVKTSMGTEIGEIIGFADDDIGKSVCECSNKDQCAHSQDREIKPVVRKAGPMDWEKIPDKKTKDEILEYCKKLVHKHELPMKLVDVHSSLDGSKLTFAFIAETRIDFRELVKDLTRHFNKTIRIQQIGIRDEARITGDCGPCGKPLCCGRFLKELSSITSEMADLQQCAHRGSERLSGACGRLKCCLAYEQKGYEDLIKDMPALGAKVNVDGKRGVVVGHHILKKSVDVQFDAENGEDKGTVVEVDLDRKNRD